MTESIRKIFYKNVDLINISGKTISYLRIQNYYKALAFSTSTIETIMSILEDIILNQAYFNDYTNLVDVYYINNMLGGLLEAQENKDYILLADLYEKQLNPFLLSLQEVIINKEEFEFDKDQYEKNIKIITNINFKLGELLRNSIDPLKLLDLGYSIEYTSCGLFTLALYDNEKKYYLHTNGQIHHEAGIIAREWFSDDKSEYLIYGLGLGYHVKELLELDESIDIKVFESDLNIIQLACAFTDMSKLLSYDNLQLIYDPNLINLNKSIQNMNQNTTYVIHYPSMRNIKDTGVREQMEDYFVFYSSINNQKHKLNNNFKKNVLLHDRYIDILKDRFIGKDLIIVAAGPSLDKNFMELKKVDKDVIILSTGTVYKKLLDSGIKPDYVIIIDANDGVYKQIEDLSQTDVPLLYLSTVNYRIPEQYQGDKYLICQEGYKEAEEYANKFGLNLFQTGGSVSTIALDIGIKFECRRIICIGLDLAYTDNYDHATDTAWINEVSPVDLRQVEDIYGNMVGTSKNLDIYRKWIERHIENVKSIEIIDATEGGAKIKGMKIKKLTECL